MNFTSEWGAEEENLKYTWYAAVGLILCVSHMQGE